MDCARSPSRQPIAFIAHTSEPPQNTNHVMVINISQDEIAGFRPTPEHLDYPGMLLQAAKGGGGDGGDGGLSSVGSPTAAAPAVAAPAYTTWYPPLRSTLQVLSKVYRAVDMGVFEDLAQLSVAACAESMKVRTYDTVGKLYTFKGAARGGRLLGCSDDTRKKQQPKCWGVFFACT